MKPEANLLDEMRDGSADRVEPVADPVKLADRGAPNWARYISFFFSIGTGACLVAIAVLTVFLQSIVAMRGESGLAGFLLALGLVPIVGAMVLDFAHVRALLGYRSERQTTGAMGQFALSAILLIALAIVHPLAAAPLFVSAGVGYLGLSAIRKWGRREPLWDFRPSESVSILSGRDELGLQLASTEAHDHALEPQIERICGWLGLVLAFATAAWLAAQGVLSAAAVPAIALITFWATQSILQFSKDLLSRRSALQKGSEQVFSFGQTDEEEAAAAALAGLHVRNLSVENENGQRLLSEVSFDVAPGEMIGVIGDAAAGKSLLLQCLVNPYDFDGLSVQGRATFNDSDLWDRSNKKIGVPVVHVPAGPRVLPATGANNLTCFQSDTLLDRGKRCLEGLVFSTESVDRIVDSRDARTLASSDQKALSLARAFLLSPSCYLLDRPEDASPDKLIAALCDRIKMERRAGRSFVIVSDNRALLENCDKLLMLQDGRVVDFASASEIRGRLSSGWLRFVAPRQLESEDTLSTWIRSHFKRGGDEENRRKLCLVAAELLALSCQDVRPQSHERICFDFKHFEGHAILKLTDDGALLTSGQMQLAHREAAQERGERGSPISKLIRVTEQVEQAMVDHRRVITVKVATYDPRKQQGKTEATNAQA